MVYGIVSQAIRLNPDRTITIFMGATASVAVAFGLASAFKKEHAGRAAGYGGNLVANASLTLMPLLAPAFFKNHALKERLFWLRAIACCLMIPSSFIKDTKFDAQRSVSEQISEKFYPRWGELAFGVTATTANLMMLSKDAIRTKPLGMFLEAITTSYARLNLSWVSALVRAVSMGRVNLTKVQSAAALIATANAVALTVDYVREKDAKIGVTAFCLYLSYLAQSFLKK
jgi:hypothetical protein